MEVLLVFMSSLPFIIFLTGYSQFFLFFNKPSDPGSTCDYPLRLPLAKAGLSKAVISMEMVRELHVTWGGGGCGLRNFHQNIHLYLLYFIKKSVFVTWFI